MSIHFNHRKAIFSVVVIFMLLVLTVGSSFIPPASTDNSNPIQTKPPSTKTHQPTVEPQKVGVPREPIPAQVIIQFAPNTTAKERAAYIKSLGGTVVENIEALDTVVVTVPEQVAKEPLPESAVVTESEPDYYVSALDDVIPNDPRYEEQWALPAIGAPSAWSQMPADAPQLTVAVIDSGICASHPDLSGRILEGWDFLESDAVPQDDFGHGCSVAGVIASNMNDGVGIAGVAPNAQIMPLRVLNASGVGSYSDVAAAIVYAADNGAQVINLSLGGSNPSSTLENAVNYAISKGVTVVAAAGNNGTEGALYPAAYPDVVAVGSVDPNLEQSSFSNYGSQIDIWAPGRDILTTKRDGSYGLVSGTSFAAPYVAGVEVLALALEKELTLNGGILNILNNIQVEPTFTPSTDTPPVSTDTPTPDLSAFLTYTNQAEEYEITYSNRWFIYPTGVSGDYSNFDQLLLSTVPLSPNDDGEYPVVAPNGSTIVIGLKTTSFLPDNVLLKDFTETYLANPFFKPPSKSIQIGNLNFVELNGELGRLLSISNGPNVFSVFLPISNLSSDLAEIDSIIGSISFTNNSRIETLPGENPNSTPFVIRESQSNGTSAQAMPSMKMPWDSSITFNYNSGPHGNSDVNYGACNPYSLSSLAGIDFSLKSTNEILAVAGGTITYYYEGTASNNGVGQYVQVDHGDGWVTQYWHMATIDQWVKDNYNKPGAVQQGQVLGKAGKSGGQTAEHLHLQLKSGGNPYGWSGVPIDGYTVRSIIDANDNSKGLNYQGTLTKGTESLGSNINYSCNSTTRPARKWTGSSGTIEAIGGPVYSSNSRKYGGGGTTPPEDQCASIKNQGNVILFDSTDCKGSSKTFSSLTARNLTDSDLNFNDKTRSIHVGPGWSVRVWQNSDYRDANRCIKPEHTNGSYAFYDLSKDYYENSNLQIYSGDNNGNNITSIKVYNNETCYEAPQGPSTPNLEIPSADQYINNSQNVTFDWSDSGDNYTFELIDGPSAHTKTGVTSSSYSYGTLWPGSYRWRVTAYRSGQSAVSGWRYLYIRPNAPNSISVTTNSTSALTVNWGDSAGIDGYKIYRNSSLIQTVGAGIHSYQDTGRSCGSTYSYSVRAYKGSLESDSANANGTTSACPVAPTIPIIISPVEDTVLVYPQNVTFDWSDSGDTYTFYFPGGPSATQYDTATSSTTVTTPLAGYYEWFVIAHRSGQNSGPSAYTDLYIVPSAPGSASVTTNSTTAVTVNWTTSLGGVDGYYIYRNDTLIQTVGSSIYSYQVTGLTCGDTSTYSVSAYRGLGSHNESPKKNVLGSTSACPVGPSVPTLLSPGNGNSIPNPQSVVFDWSASGDSYNIEITGGPSATNTNVTPDSLSFGSMWPGVYQWRVRAYRNGTWSAWSNQWTLNVPPGAPGSVSVTPNSTSAVTVNWTSSPGGVDGYKVYRNGGLVTTVNGSTYSYQVTGLTCEDTSTYSVVGYKGALDSASKSASGATAECPKTVRVLSSFITDENGTATSLAVGPRILAGDTQASAIKTDFNAGDNVQLFMEVENQYATAQTAYFEWIVFDPALREIPELEWRGNLSTASGTIQWLLPTTIPTEVLTGEYTFIGAITFNGEQTSAYYDFNVTGIQSVEAINVYTTDELGAAGLGAKLDSGKVDLNRTKTGDNVNSNSIKTTFNAGNPIQLYIDYYNNVSEGEIAAYEWSVIDPWGRLVPDLSYSSDLDNYLYDGWWRLNRVIPTNAVTGTYTYTGSITHNGRTTSRSTTFYVNGSTGPSNDNFGTPITINSVPYSTFQNTWSATVVATDPTPTCGSGKNSNSVWYRYIAPSNGLLEINTWGSDYDTVLAVWTGTISNLTSIQCNDDIDGYMQASLQEVPITAGNTYYIEVMDYGNSGGGNLELYFNFATSTSNNDFNTPTVVNTLPYSVTQNTRGATKANDDPTLTSCNRLPGQASVWYRYTPSVNANLLIDTKGSDYDTLLAVWTGSRGSLVSIGCNDDIGTVNGVWDQDSILTVPVTTGTTYYIEASTFNGYIDTNGASAEELQSKPNDVGASANSLQDKKTEIDENGGLITDLQSERSDEMSAQFWGGTLQLHVYALYTISGNAEVAGSTLSYTDGTVKTVTANGSGEYSIVVPSGWNGIVTPYKSGYTFTPVSRSYTNVQSNQTAQDYTAQVCASCADVNVTISGDSQGNYTLGNGEERRLSFNVSGGPVKVESSDPSKKIVTAIRLQSYVNNTLYSFAETMGVPSGLLSYKYYFPSYNNIWAPLNSQIRFSNLDANPTTIRVTIGGNNVWEQQVLGGEEKRLSFDVSGGPVIIESLDSSKKIAAAIRLQSYANNTLYSFAETMGIPAEQVSNTYYFPSYNNIWAPLNSQLRIGNLNASDVTVRVTIGGDIVWEDVVPGLDEKRLSFNVSGGPVKVESLDPDPSKKIVTAIRLQSYVNNTLYSFAETMGVPNGLLSYKYYFPSYNNIWAPLNSQIRFSNLDANPTTIRVTIGGNNVWEQQVLGGEEKRLSFDVSGGPVIIESLDPAKKIAAAIRLQSYANNTLYSFAETMGIPAEQVSNTYYFPSYNNIWAPLNSQLRFGLP